MLAGAPGLLLALLLSLADEPRNSSFRFLTLYCLLSFERFSSPSENGGACQLTLSFPVQATRNWRLLANQGKECSGRETGESFSFLSNNRKKLRILKKNRCALFK